MLYIYNLFLFPLFLFFLSMDILHILESHGFTYTGFSMSYIA